MTLYTDRLILRPWEESDAEDLYEYAKDPEVGPIAGWPVHRSVEDSLEIIRNVLSAPETYAVCLKQNGRAVGSIGMFEARQSHTVIRSGEMEIGYWIGVPFWGRGLIPEAVRRLQKHAFEDLGAAGLWCGYFDGNEKSRKAQEKCGFRYHHTEKDIPWELMNDIRTEHFTYISREEWETGIVVRELSKSEQQAALDLCLDVFMQFEAPDYSEEGVAEFRKSLDDRERITGLKFYGAFVCEELAGVLCMRKPQHFSYFFVKEEYQGKGLGRQLFERMKQDYDIKEFTVNSSPYAVEIYRHMGFVPTDTEQTVNGIRFTPMKYSE